MAGGGTSRGGLWGKLGADGRGLEGKVELGRSGGPGGGAEEGLAGGGEDGCAEGGGPRGAWLWVVLVEEDQGISGRRWCDRANVVVEGAD